MFTIRGILSATRDSFFLADDTNVSVAQAYGKNRRFPCSRKVYLRRKDSPWNASLVQIRDRGKREPVSTADVFFSEEATVRHLIIIHVVHLSNSGITLFLWDVSPAFFYVCTGRRSWTIGSSPKGRDQWDAPWHPCGPWPSSVIFVDLRLSWQQTISVQEFKSGINWTEENEIPREREKWCSAVTS